MKRNEYDAAEAVEIGKAAALVLGDKVAVPDLDSSGGEPMFWQYRTTD
jgi:hypothetical protein